MTTWELLEEKKDHVGPWLRRAFWLPLRSMLRMFHVLPVTAALVVLVLLATDGQLGEIYITYLEDLGSGEFAAMALRILAAAAGFALISAVLYEAHYLLSATRINVVYSNSEDLSNTSRLHPVQEVAATILALCPWLGLVAGLFHANVNLTKLATTLQDAKAAPTSMLHVPLPSAWAIIAAILVMGLAASSIVAAHPKRPRLQRAIILLSPPAAALLFVLLRGWSFAGLAAAQIIAIVAFVLAALAYYFFCYWQQTTQALIFSRALQHDIGINLRKYENLLLFVWALLPWLAALALYFVFATAGENRWAMVPVAMSWVISIGLGIAILLHSLRERRSLKWGLYGTVVSLGVVGLFVSWLPQETIVVFYRLVGPLGAMAFTLLFLIFVFALLAVLSQRSGFPALTLIVLTLVASVLLPIPIAWTVSLLGILCLVVLAMAIISRLWAVACVALVLAITGAVNYAKERGQPLTLNDAVRGKNLTQEFSAWLDRRGVARAGGSGTNTAAPAKDPCFAKATGRSQKEPVFIIAVEGGGIYAASAASMFLARLQDEDSCFADHVFAVSAVSGGAIGSTVFQAIDEARLGEVSANAMPPKVAGPQRSPGTSASASAIDPAGGSSPASWQSDRSTINNSMEKEITGIIEDDHFSPLIASIFPELLGFTNSGRAEELTASFVKSVETRDPAAANALKDPFNNFANRWRKGSKAPALILNATWVETGYRTAFAPFPLHSIDDSLYSFLDKEMPDDRKLSLIDAAGVSARFPGVVPPYSVKVQVNESGKSGGQAADQNVTPSEPMRWNFVDGGYSDNSGAATALSVYKALENTAMARNVVLRVILLTSSDPRLDPRQINGTAFADTMGPVDAIMNVRAGLANEAVARACDGVTSEIAMKLKPKPGPGQANGAKENTCEDITSQPGSPLLIVGIEDQTYGLSLGWKISQTTFGVVSWMLGDPDYFDDAACSGTVNDSNPTSQANGQFTLNEKVVRNNSCALRSILQSLRGEGSGPTFLKP